MKINWTQTIPAGLVATLALDLSGLLMTGKWWDIPNLLGAKLGTGLLGGLVMHYGIGIILAAMFVAVAPSLKGPLSAALRGSASVLAPASGTAPTAMNIGNLTRTA